MEANARSVVALSNGYIHTARAGRYRRIYTYTHLAMVRERRTGRIAEFRSFRARDRESLFARVDCTHSSRRRGCLSRYTYTLTMHARDFLLHCPPPPHLHSLLFNTAHGVCARLLATAITLIHVRRGQYSYGSPRQVSLSRVVCAYTKGAKRCGYIRERERERRA